MKELSQNLGSAFGRLINETMIPLVTKILAVMDERGIISLPLKVNGLEIKVSAVAPLAMAQAMEDVQNVLQYAQIVQGVGPQGQAMIKIDSMLEFIAEKLGIPQRILNTAEERMMIQQQQAQMAMMAAQAAPEAVPEMVKGAMQQGAM
jgi:hypothetical protein